MGAYNYARQEDTSDSLIRERRRFVTGALDRFVHSSVLDLSRVERHKNRIQTLIDPHVVNSVDLHQRLANSLNAFFTIIPVRRDLDRLHDRVIGGVVQVMRVGRVHVHLD